MTIYQGLLLPTVVVDDFGGLRRDAGMLGAGIYFGNLPSTAAQYSEACGPDKIRFMLVSEVALGAVYPTTTHDPTLERPPDGFDSVHGVSKQSSPGSDFTDDEFVVYNPYQQRLQYLIAFDYEDSEVPLLQKTEAGMDSRDPKNLSTPFTLEHIMTPEEASPINVHDVLHCRVEDVQDGLQSDEPDVDIPVRETHVRASLVDLAAEVTIFQK